MGKKALLSKVDKLKQLEDRKDTMYCTNATCKKKGIPLKITSFYNSNTALGGKYPICKDCIKRRIDVDRMYTVYDVLKEMNIAFIPSTWATAITKSKENPFGKYLVMMNSGVGGTKQPFQESQIQNVDIEEVITRRLEREKKLKSKNKVDSSFINFWGNGFTDEEYVLMQQKYDFIKDSYPLLSNMHIENLKSFVMPSVKADLALSRNDLSEYKSWKQMADQASDRAKLNVKQLSKSDLQGGIDSFSELVVAVEQAVDVISIVPKVRYRPNDSADFIIWQEINYLRDILSMPQVAYEEIYNFYEKKKQDYIETQGDPFGIFKDDPTEKNRKIIEKFIDIDDKGSDEDE